MIIPSIDLIEGNIVRLYQGNYDTKTFYQNNIYDIALKYYNQGAKIVHLVDLDGALCPNNKQTSLIKNLLNYFNFHIQVGGGIRSYKDVETLLLNGAKRVVIGSSAINNITEVEKWLLEFGYKSIVLALDVYVRNNGYKEVVINGWKNRSNVSLESVLERFSTLGIKYVLCTDVKKDGTCLGPNFTLYKNISKLFKNVCFQLSGGIGTISDVISAKKSGIKDIIIGRALLENKFSLLEAIRC
ncbi:phosphoribosylformimino-5-aminoimidazole carboxamide ribotide isomerase [Buchnera aphidicola str. Bp (Baizongia pistaciae)]|uniref:1-(5-phosphoribosyl)-5-[(5-phosphoribosylamino)methylideneamino] imidazole-4-carboxamide isomerase n=1 Tax=Buchnera aphidicola subsp. Baizongia pistaciae (strain Bp) TaxID=224915 RepID=HIS4_BUCBP|nr:1-(5-phosphoribosyl)-5-[(5-phosphoribosylamino)methylideneamino]imidazole-4-carboxamide isomerase [Buchnera aphidicola]P59520.1 RecName: Full=1-(5-phosphoribosyl)-5-[(5-phosphoribosylamino)methylideneamino] imidazole-4-carboxamide isomerase; AltName: Full=Phosphoribosylformimino-5-aminoimidazole carboxamide ribotide isomerase [Buchnera aphidicola str. Bp (Baizongia pistaciae)]AAO26833.1 phosphoribosylformimino-5-aminoimidazole carboxamide ribotide isomerase [Buchnera aphidicola str. Bp (Baizon